MRRYRKSASGFPDGLPSVDVMFPFLKYGTNSISSDLNQSDSSVISHESSNEWICLGENGFENVDDPPLEPIFDSSTWALIQNETGDTDWKIIESVMADASNHHAAAAGPQNERRDNFASECFNDVCGTLGNKTFSTTLDVQRDFSESSTNSTNRNLLKNYCVSEDLKTRRVRKEKKYEISFDHEIPNNKNSLIKTINFESAKDIAGVLAFIRANSAAVARGEKMHDSSPSKESSLPTEHYSQCLTDSDPGLQSNHLFEVKDHSSFQSSIDLRRVDDDDMGSNPARSQTGKRMLEPRRSKRHIPYKYCKNCWN